MARASTVPLQEDVGRDSRIEVTYDEIKNKFAYKGKIDNPSFTFDKFKKIYERVFEPVLLEGKSSGSMSYNYYYKFFPLYEIHRGDSRLHFQDFCIQTMASFSRVHPFTHTEPALLDDDMEAYKKYFENEMIKIAGKKAVDGAMSRPFRLPERFRSYRRRFGHVTAAFGEPRVLSPEEREALRRRPERRAEPAPEFRPLGRSSTRGQRVERMRVGFRPTRAFGKPK